MYGLNKYKNVRKLELSTNNLESISQQVFFPSNKPNRYVGIYTGQCGLPFALCTTGLLGFKCKVCYAKRSLHWEWFCLSNGLLLIMRLWTLFLPFLVW